MLLVLSFSKAFGTKKIEFREFTNKCKPGVEQNIRFPELVCWTCLSSRVRFTVHSGRLFFRSCLPHSTRPYPCSELVS